MVLLTGGLFGYAIGTNKIAMPYNINYRPLSLPHHSSPLARPFIEQLDAARQTLPIVKSLMEDPEWKHRLAYDSIPREDLKSNLTAGALDGLGRLALPPLLFYKEKTKEFIAVFHIGQDLCGHRGITHGKGCISLYRWLFGYHVGRMFGPSGTLI